MARSRPEPWYIPYGRLVLNKPAAWQRGLWMLLFWLIGSALTTVLTGIAVLQFASLLLTDRPQSWLAEFGTRLNHYQYQLWQFLLAATEQKPWFSETPEPPPAPAEPPPAQPAPSPNLPAASKSAP